MALAIELFQLHTLCFVEKGGVVLLQSGAVTCVVCVAQCPMGQPLCVASHGAATSGGRSNAGAEWIQRFGGALHV